MPRHLHCVVVIVWFDKTLNKKKLFGGKRDIEVWVSTRTLDDVIHERASHLVYIRKYLLSSHRIFDQKKNGGSWLPMLNITGKQIQIIKWRVS